MLIFAALESPVPACVYHNLIKQNVDTLTDILDHLKERSKARHCQPTGRQYPEMPAAIVQPFNRLVSEGMGRDVEEKVVILHDHILKSARQRCGITSMAQLQPKNQISTGQGKVGFGPSCSSNSGPAEFDLTGKENKPWNREWAPTSFKTCK